MNIIIAGGRDFLNRDMFDLNVGKILQELYTPLGLTIISGGALGADSMAIDYAFDNSHDYLVFDAEWDKYGLSAGYKRNQKMADVSTFLIAFWDGISDGTGNMIEIADEMDIETVVVRYDQYNKHQQR